MKRLNKDTRLYNVIFPFWSLLFVPKIWLIVLPANFVIDSFVLFVSLWALGIDEIIGYFKRHIFKVFAFGMLADILGAIYLFFMSSVDNIGKTVGWTFVTVTAIVIAAVLIFLFNYFITFRKLEKQERCKLSLIFALVTAPYTYLMPSRWLI